MSCDSDPSRFLAVHVEQPPGELTGRPAKGRHADARRALGRLGEDLAAEHLARTGFTVLRRNERTPHGEIDLIAFDGRTLVFAEVKTSRVSARGRPPRADQQPLTRLRHSQCARLRRLAVAWLSDDKRARPTARSIRFDAIGVIVDGGDSPLRIDHIENAW